MLSNSQEVISGLAVRRRRETERDDETQTNTADSVGEILDSGILETLEHELEERDSTIRHLTQELSRVRSAFSILESSVTAVNGRSDAEVQVLNDLSEFIARKSDGSVQTDDIPSDENLTVTQSRDSDSQADLERDIRDAASFCLISLSVNDESSQTDVQSVVPEIETSDQQLEGTGKHEAGYADSWRPETTEHESQWDKNDAQEAVVDLSDKETQLETSDLADGKVDASQQASPSVDSAVCQTADDLSTSTDTADQGTQSDGFNLSTVQLAIFADHETQCENDSASAGTETCPSDLDEKTSQTEFLALFTEEREVQCATFQPALVSTAAGSDYTVQDIESQTDVSGDVSLLRDNLRLAEQEQLVRTDLIAAVSTNERLKKESERLRAHLLNVEQAYAQDFHTVQIREDELRNVIQQLETQLAAATVSQQQNSTEVHDQISNLEEQVTVLSQARDEAVTKLHEAEKRNQQLDGSLSNIRMAVENIKRENNLLLDQEREKSRKVLQRLEEQLRDVSLQNLAYQEKILLLDAERSTNNKLAADNERFRLEIADLNLQLEEKDVFLSKALDDAASVGTNKVEKALLRSMILGYFVGPKSVQNDILRMLMATLDFSKGEKQKIQTTQQSGLRSLFSASPSTKSSSIPDDNFGNMLVKFIEQESIPKVSGEMGNASPQQSLRFPSAAGLFDGTSSVSSSSSSRSTPIPVGASNFLTMSGESAEKQDQVLQKILDGSIVKSGSIDTV